MALNSKSPLKYGKREFILLIAIVATLSLLLIVRITNNIVKEELLAQARSIAETVDQVGKWAGNSHDNQIWINQPEETDAKSGRFINILNTRSINNEVTRYVSKNPANVVNSVGEFVDSEDGYKIRFRMTSDNPMNPSNLSSAFGIQALNKIRINQSLDEYYQIKDGLFLYARAVLHDKESCIACHESPALAPKGVVEGYGSENGYGFKLNDLAGVIEVSIPNRSVLGALGVIDYIIFMVIILILFIFMFFRVIPSYRQVVNRNVLLNIKLDDTIDAEREQLSTFLHDNVSGVINGIRFSMAGIRKKIRNKNINYEQIEEHISTIESQLKECYRSTRSMGTDVFSETLAARGLLSAITELVASKTDSHIMFTLDIDDIDENKIPSKINIDIYRIIQELLLNVEKHSESNACLTQITSKGDGLYLQVKDNGKGFDNNNLDGRGLGIIKTRVEKLNGEIRFHANDGLQVDINLPCIFIKETVND